MTELKKVDVTRFSAEKMERYLIKMAKLTNETLIERFYDETSPPDEEEEWHV